MKDRVASIYKKEDGIAWKDGGNLLYFASEKLLCLVVESAYLVCK